MRFALGTALLALDTVACAAEPVGEDLFEVVSAVPEDGAPADAATRPELRVSAAADPAPAPPRHPRRGRPHGRGLRRLRGRAGASRWPDEGRKIVLAPDEPLPQGFTYAYLVRAGSDACSDTLGRSLGPFYAEFTVP
ncbi:MAG: hypothetical protein H6740_01370 [Alphaproteobacteria bacterium]|nr:hypothetical protein [Alphaproteobacteria bacterium]